MAALKPKGRSFDEVKSLVRMALETKHGTGNGNGYLWLSDIYSDMVVYQVEPKIGKAVSYSATYSIGTDGAVTLGDPTQVVQKKVYETVSFEVDFTAEFSADSTGEVVKDARLFRLGDYPDKGFSLDETEAEEIVIPKLKAGLGLEVEHKQKTVFSGKLGKTVDSWLVGDELYGKISFPSAVAGLLKGTKPAFSMRFDPVTKEPIELSIVSNPRITDAGLLAAFSENEKPKARSGTSMSFFDKLAETLGLKKSDVVDEFKAEFSQDNSDLEARLKKVEAENLALKQGISSFSAATAATTAANLAQKYLTGGKIAPAELASVTAAFSATLTADNGVTFDNGEQKFGAATAALISAFEARPVIPHLSPATFASVSAVASTTEAPKPLTSDEVYAKRRGAK